MTKSGLQKPDFYGSFLLASTVRLGCDEHGEEVHIPFKDLVPIVRWGGSGCVCPWLCVQGEASLTCGAIGGNDR